MILEAKEHAVVVASTIKDSSIAALHDGKVGMTIGVSTIFAGLTANEIAACVGALASTAVFIFTVINAHATIKRTKREEMESLLRQEIDRAKLRAIQKAEALGKKPQRKSDHD